MSPEHEHPAIATGETEAIPRRPLTDAVFFVALMSTAIAFGGALAHALELPNKITMSRDDYFVMQQAYRGWDQLAFVLAAQFVSLAAAAVLSWRRQRVAVPVLVAIACLIAAQGLFWMFTFPANTVTGNWTLKPENWEALRARWEYSHAAGAALQLGAMAAIALATIRRSHR
jgi:hypothetical protein